MPTNLQISQNLFNHICNALQVTPTIDLFADPSTFKIRNYISSIPTKEAVALNAFSVYWGLEKQMYAFPPVELVGKVLHKWNAEGTGRLLLIAPEWHTQPYYSLLTRLAKRKYHLQVHRKDLFENLTETFYLEDPSVFKLTAYLL